MQTQMHILKSGHPPESAKFNTNLTESTRSIVFPL